jgi:hypothetical protein
LKTTAFLVYPPHFYKYNCNKHCHLTLHANSQFWTAQRALRTQCPMN